MNNLGLDPTLGLIRWYVMWYNMMCPSILAMWCWFPFVKLRSFVYNAVKHNLIEGVTQPRSQWWSQSPSHISAKEVGFPQFPYIFNSTVWAFHEGQTSPWFQEGMQKLGYQNRRLGHGEQWTDTPTAAEAPDCVQHTFVDDISKFQQQSSSVNNNRLIKISTVFICCHIVYGVQIVDNFKVIIHIYLFAHINNYINIYIYI